MCRLFRVSRGAYYDYTRRQASRFDELCHMKLIEAIRNIAESSHYTYGSRRMKKALNAMDYKVGHWKVRKLMKEAGVQVRHRKKYKVTTNSNHKQPVFENKLNRQFNVTAPNQAYVGDITYRAPILRRCH